MDQLLVTIGCECKGPRARLARREAVSRRKRRVVFSTRGREPKSTSAMARHRYAELTQTQLLLASPDAGKLKAEFGILIGDE